MASWELPDFGIFSANVLPSLSCDQMQVRQPAETCLEPRCVAWYCDQLDDGHLDGITNVKAGATRWCDQLDFDLVALTLWHQNWGWSTWWSDRLDDDHLYGGRLDNNEQVDVCVLGPSSEVQPRAYVAPKTMLVIVTRVWWGDFSLTCSRGSSWSRFSCDTVFRAQTVVTKLAIDQCHWVERPGPLPYGCHILRTGVWGGGFSFRMTYLTQSPSWSFEVVDAPSTFNSARGLMRG